jgi:hypothetical protein
VSDCGRPSSFFGRFRSVPSARFANAVVVLYAVSTLGGIVYLYFRIDVRPELERTGHWSALGFFDLKEHFVAIGLALLPAYWVWRWPGADEPTHMHDAHLDPCLHHLVGGPDGSRHQQHRRFRRMTSSAAFRRFALVFGATFSLLYVIAVAKDLALFTVFPSLGIVLAGTQYTNGVTLNGNCCDKCWLRIIGVAPRFRSLDVRSGCAP